MYIKKFVYTINDFIQEAQNHYPIFDIYFLYKALDSFIIKSDNALLKLRRLTSLSVQAYLIASSSELK